MRPKDAIECFRAAFRGQASITATKRAPRTSLSNKDIPIMLFVELEQHELGHRVRDLTLKKREQD